MKRDSLTGPLARKLHNKGRISATVTFQESTGIPEQVKRFPPSEAGLQQAKFFLQAYLKLAGVKSMCLANSDGKHIFTGQGDYLFTILLETGP